MKKIPKFSIFSLMVGLFVLPISLFAVSENITQINFTSEAQTIDKDALSGVISVQTQNESGESEKVSETNHLNLSSSSSTGEFYNANASACTTVLASPFQLTQSSNSANKNFCYKDSTPGTYILTVTADGQDWTSATQEIIINSATDDDEEDEDDEDGDDGDEGGDEEDDEDGPQTETFIIRNGDTLIWTGEIELPESGTIEILDSNDTVHEVDAQSVLALLMSIDEESDDFEITDLQYYDSFSSFYLRCITPLGSNELCDNWQYAVGSSTPFTSIDTTVLSGEETVGIYFGSPHQVTFSSLSISTADSLIATAEKYDYENNLWNPLTGVSIGVTLPDPENPWSPIVVSTHEVDEFGVASIEFEEANTYNLGIAEDYYFPSYAIIVASPSESTGGGGGGGTISPVFSIEEAIAYLKNVQGDDGSFADSVLYSDWAGIAYGAYGVSGAQKQNLISYMKMNNSISSLFTDNERRAMAILSLGENPYSFDGVNYIQAILDEFDGNQFGSTSLVNDDIFAILPLSHAGYDTSDIEITKSLDFIISKQKSNGSWENSIDITSASVQALSIFKNYQGVEDALDNAKAYLAGSQLSDGGFGSVYASAWALQAMEALNENWTNGKSLQDYFSNIQEEDGSVLPETDTLANRIWSISYVIPAMMEKTWGDVMNSVGKPVLQNDTQNNSSDSGVETELVQNKNTEMDDEEIARLVAEILAMVEEEEAKNANTVNEVAVVINDTVLAQEEINEDTIEELIGDTLLASANESGKNTSLPIILISVGGLSLVVLIVRKFLL